MPTRPGSPRSVAAVVNKLKNLDAGVQKHLTAASLIPVNGQWLTQGQLHTQLTAWLQIFQDVDDAKAAVKAKLAVGARALPDIEEALPSMVVSFRNVFGSGSPKLAGSSVSPRKKARRKQTAAERIVSLAQWYATRKTRGTMGKQHKAVTTAGKPGVIIVSPDGKQLPGGRPPVPPRKK